MRIISGEWGGRNLPKVTKGVRPTPDRAREALFSILFSRGVIWEKTTVLDLFCGSGAVGIESLSRGAQFVCFTDKSNKNIQQIQTFLGNLDAQNRFRCIQAALPQQLALCRGGLPESRADLIFVDAPFEMNLHPAVVLQDPVADELFAKNCLVVWEQESSQPEFESIEGWHAEDCRKYGRVRFYFYKRATPA